MKLLKGKLKWKVQLVTKMDITVGALDRYASNCNQEQAEQMRELALRRPAKILQATLVHLGTLKFLNYLIRLTAPYISGTV